MPHSFFIPWSKQKDNLFFEVDDFQGPFFFDRQGNKIFDLASGSFHAGFGFNNSTIIEKITHQLKKNPTSFPKVISPLKERVSRRLLSFLKSEGRIFYTVSGAEAVENAAKMARIVTGRKIIAARKPSYHGATLGALSITGDWRRDGHIFFDDHILRLPEPKEDPHAKFTRDLIIKTGPESIAAFCLETISGANGVLIPPLSWWRGIEKICKDYNIKLILDEVICGFRRTGASFAFHHFSLSPDFVCMAKGITGGYIPFGAVFVREDNARYFDLNTLSCGLTNYAHPLGLAALDAVLDIMEDDSFLKNVINLEKIFKQKIIKLSLNKNINAVRMMGLLAALDLKRDLHWQQFMKENIHLIIHNQRAVLAPSLIYKPHELDYAMECLITMLNKDLKCLPTKPSKMLRPPSLT